MPPALHRNSPTLYCPLRRPRPNDPSRRRIPPDSRSDLDRTVARQTSSLPGSGTRRTLPRRSKTSDRPTRRPCPQGPPFPASWRALTQASRNGNNGIRYSQGSPTTRQPFLRAWRGGIRVTTFAKESERVYYMTLLRGHHDRPPAPKPKPSPKTESESRGADHAEPSRSRPRCRGGRRRSGLGQSACLQHRDQLERNVLDRSAVEQFSRDSSHTEPRV